MGFNSDKTVTANAVDALRNYILKHDLKPGDSLPTESEFAELFAVSRGIIREALQYFRTLGIIESRPRKGMTIKNFLPENPFGPYLPFCRHDEDRAAICEMRAIIDLGIIHILIKKIVPEEIQQLKSVAESMGTADFTQLRELDYKFHRKLLSIAGNKFLNCLEPFMLDYFDAVNNTAEEYYQNPEKYRKDEKEKHLAIVKAIQNANEETASKLLKSHYFLT